VCFVKTGPALTLNLFSLIPFHENRPCTDPEPVLTHPFPYSFICTLPSTADAVMPDGSFKELTLAQYKGKFLVLVMYPRT